ncbi:hypothetical protein I3842_01G063300 [Carya illinoinensis]|uniref:Uncharacterized protein n=1 Tax=Carya illinoinensis TaxID=32201 RepID=A0A922FX83_CARIL|nr:hypothetical protein I3842_01G063300 [Carya illinoinensis]
MSLENEDHILDQPVETNHETQKKLKTSYSREFLLSLSELDVCKKLPGGFDQSILSDFEDSFQDRQRISGGLSSHSYKRNEYGSSPPTRGDFSSYSRGVHGRWEGRSSVRSDKDSDSQPDLESADTGRQYGNQSRRSWQVPEHDGLLGSGSFPRPSGLAAGVSASKFRANDHYHLNKSTEPYHPPRPYKAVPHSRRDTHDSFNDETFGSSEFTSEDKAEEERKRRASFELMRKEQHKAFQDKQNLNPDKRKDVFDITTLLEDSKDEKNILNRSKESDEPVKASLNDPEKSSLPSQTPASRPLVPPGFKSTVLERNSGPKSVIHPQTAEVVNPELENSLSHAKVNLVLNGTSDNKVEKQLTEQKGFTTQQLGSTSNKVSIHNKSDKNLNVPSSSMMDVDGQLHKISCFSEAFEASEDGEVNKLSGEKVTGNKIIGESNRDHSTSILDKLFGSALTSSVGGSSSFIEHPVSTGEETGDRTVEETRSSHATQSSKFARWFLEEEKKPMHDLSSTPKDLFSLIVGGDKGGSLVSDVKNTEHIIPNIPFERSEPAEEHKTSNVTADIVENSEQFYKNDKPQALPAVLTCEDLEQSMLSEISENGSTLQPPVHVSSIPDPKTELPKVNIDDHASQHLLSLLLKDGVPSSNLDIQSSEKLQSNEETSFVSAAQTKEVNAEHSSNSGQTLTLETLFGTAFMKELQSVGAPVSVQRGSLGPARVDKSDPHQFPFSVMDDALVLTNDIVPNKAGYESSVLTSKQRLQTKPANIEQQWLGFDDPQTDLDSSQLRTGLNSNLGGLDGPVDIRLPEEDSLITVNDPLNPRNYASVKTAARAEVLPSPNTQVDIAEKLAALKSVFKEERSFMGGQEGPPRFRGAYDVREPDFPYQNLSVQPSSPQFHPPRANHVGPFSHPLDSHPTNVNPQMKFMTPEGIIHHDSPPNHQFSANMLHPHFHHPSTGLTGFDPPNHHPMLQQMHMSGNFPPHLLQGFPRSAPMSAQPSRGAPLPSHANNQMTGFMPELNPLQAFPFGHRQPNFSGLGMPPPAPEIGGGSNNPEAIQRLFELELRTNSKKIQPFAAGGHGQGMYGHEVDMGFRYR